MRWLANPLVHFALGGALLFGAHEWMSRVPEVPAKAIAHPIRIGPGEVAWLQETWIRQWERPATREEMTGLVTTFVKEELLAREALSIGLDRDDTLVRRRLAQKLSFLLEDTFRLAEPTETELHEYFETNAARYEQAARVSFRHVFFDPEKRADANADARAALAQLEGAQADAWESLGDRLLIDAAIADADRHAIASQLGEKFADAVLNLPPGTWHGPLQSAYGIHIVIADARVAAKPAEFAYVESRVREDVYQDRHRVEVANYYSLLTKKYALEVDPDVRGMIGPLDELLPQAIGGGSESP